MPELPEVETVRSQLSRVLPGRRLVTVTGADHPRFRAARDAVGMRVAAVDRRGKFLLLRLGTDGPVTHDFVVHLGMTGQLTYTSAEDRSPQVTTVSVAGADPHLHVVVELDDGGVLHYRDVRKFGRLLFTPTGVHHASETLTRMGPEPLSTAFTLDGFAQALTTSGAQVKALLLSQRPVAGLGNIYVDEALWLAGIHPQERHVQGPRVAQLHAAIGQVLRAAIAAGGTTFRDYRTADGRAGDNLRNLAVYGRGGLPCLRCGEVLASGTVAGRTSVWCPVCQPERTQRR